MVIVIYFFRLDMVIFLEFKMSLLMKLGYKWVKIMVIFVLLLKFNKLIFVKCFCWIILVKFFVKSGKVNWFCVLVECLCLWVFIVIIWYFLEK